MDRAGIPAGFAALTREYAMLPAGGHVLCAVSGGADSVCLLHLLKGQAEAAGFSLTAAHFDHGLRGEDSRRDAAFVAQLCQDWGVPCVTGSGDVAVEAGRRGAGLEETARDLVEKQFKTGLGTIPEGDTGAVRAAGAKQFPLVTTVVGMWGVRIPIAALSAWVWHADIIFVFFGIAFDQFVRRAIAIVFRKKKQIFPGSWMRWERNVPGRADRAS